VLLFELEVLEHIDGRHQMAETEIHLWACGQGRRRAHLLGHRVGEVTCPLLVFGQDRLQHIEALLAAGL
jgi:hypothetical protein